MTHRAETIMQAVYDKVKALDSTGDVERGRAVPVESESLTAVSIYQGSDTKINDTYPLVNSDLRVNIEAHAKSSLDDVETKLNEIREDINLALLADNPPLELSFCVDISEESATPSVNAYGERQAGVMEIEYLIRYRRTRANPGA